MESDSSNRVRVEIYGTEYTLRGDVSAEYLRNIAHHVDDLMKQIVSANPHLDQTRVAVLAALNMADELTKLRAEHEQFMTLLDELTGSPTAR